MRNKKLTIVLLVVLSIIFSLFFSAKARALFICKKGETWIDPKYVEYCEEIGDMYGISPEFLEAIIEQESSGKPNVVSSLGCIGLMQVDPRWHGERMRGLCVTEDELYDPYQNILVATDYLAELFAEYEEADIVLKEYGGWQGDDGEVYIDNILERAYELEIVHEKTPAVG